MNFKNACFAFLFFCFAVPSLAQLEALDPILSKYEVQNLSKKNMDRVASKFEVIARTQNGYEVLVPLDQQKEFLTLAPSAQLLQRDISQDLMSLGLVELASYRSFEQVHAQLYKWAQEYPNLAEVIQYGTSKRGRPLLALKISDGKALGQPEPELMLTAATHGDELITTEVLLNLMEKLLVSYNKDERLTKILSQHELYFIPVVNADGFASRQRYDNGQDPNRSYPWPGDLNAKPTASIASLLSFFHQHNFVGSIDFHAYGELVMYPWAYTNKTLPADERSVFDGLANHMAELNRYKTGPIAEVIYVAQGSSADYYFWKNKTLAFGIEIGRNKIPRADEIPLYTETQAESTWRFIESF